MLSATTITDLAELRALRPEWEELLGRSSDNEINLRPQWLLPWWDVFGATDGRKLRFVALREGEGDRQRLVGLAPLLARGHRYRRAIPFRRLEILGSGEDQADETCSDYLGVIAERDREAEVVEALTQALTSGGFGAWDELVVHSMSGQSRLPSLWAEALRARGFDVALDEYSSSPYIPLPKTWDAYLGALKPAKRSQLKKALRNFEAWAGGPPTITRVTAPSELARGKQILIALHGARWGSDGVFASPKFRAFHDQLMAELLADGSLDLGWLSVRDEPVAAFYNFRHDGRLLFYQSGRKVDLPEDIRVGITMHAYIIQSAIESGIREYDFLAGPSQYKMSLALETRPLLKLRATRRGLRELARQGSERGIAKVKALRDHGDPRVKPLLDKLDKLVQKLKG